MLTTLHKGAFKAFAPHDWDEEKVLFEEMQEIADWTAGVRTVEQFNLTVQTRIELLNNSYEQANRRFDVYFNDKGALILYQQLIAQYYRSELRMYLPCTIGEYSILRPENLIYQNYSYK